MALQVVGNKKLEKTAIIIGASVVIGFLGDLVMYSLARSKGSKFKFYVPRGMELAQVLALGFATGVVIDVAVNNLEESLKTDQEKALDKLVADNVKKIEAGQLSGRVPVDIEWEIKNTA
jgi:hypothetical protein